MDLCEDKIRKSLVKLNEIVKSSEINKLLKEKVWFAKIFLWNTWFYEFIEISFKELSSQHVDEIIELLCKLLLQNPQLAYQIRLHFTSLLLPVVSRFLSEANEDFAGFQRKCIALSILAETNQQVSRYVQLIHSNSCHLHFQF